MSNTSASSTFESLGLEPQLLSAVEASGYREPSPIQAASIPVLLEGHDLLGLAQTGTGKTAAFALPALQMLDKSLRKPQVLVITPTRELAIQVAQFFEKYTRQIKGISVLPVYGGQTFSIQLKALKQGPQVVVGTPGRLMDHIERGKLILDDLNMLVLDEADEMLRMGFIDDVEWILQHTPSHRQIALFSATMPNTIKRVAQRYLNQPKEIKIAAKTTTASNINQRFWVVKGLHKLDALSRIIELEQHDAMLVFVRTKSATLELTEKLGARGYSCEALNGDIPQNAREKIVERLKQGKFDVLVATDVVARGLDVERISHVINYDIPFDSEAYVHRIGRTGRAGRSGEAVLFVSKNEMRLLKTIERTTKQPIQEMQVPSVEEINNLRVQRFKSEVMDTIALQDDLGVENPSAQKVQELALFKELIDELQYHEKVEPYKIALALLAMAQHAKPLLLQEEHPRRKKLVQQAQQGASQSYQESTARSRQNSQSSAIKHASRPVALSEFPDLEMERFRIEVGHRDGVKPGNIVGAVANEAGLESQYIGQIEIFDEFSTIVLPSGMPGEVFHDLKKVWVCQRQLKISRLTGHVSDSKKLSKKRKKRKSQNRSLKVRDTAKDSKKKVA